MNRSKPSSRFWLRPVPLLGFAGVCLVAVVVGDILGSITDVSSGLMGAILGLVLVLAAAAMRTLKDQLAGSRWKAQILGVAFEVTNAGPPHLHISYASGFELSDWLANDLPSRVGARFPVGKFDRLLRALIRFAYRREMSRHVTRVTSSRPASDVEITTQDVSLRTITICGGALVIHGKVERISRDSHGNTTEWGEFVITGLTSCHSSQRSWKATR